MAGAAVTPSHRGKFRVAYVVLVLCLVAGALALGFELNGSSSSSTSQAVAGDGWSSWHPQLTGVVQVLEIADHVGSEYHLAKGQPLSRIKAGYPAKAGVLDPAAPVRVSVSVSTIAVATTDATGQTSYSLTPGYPTTIQYQLCGPGPRCNIPKAAGGGTPRVEELLHREELELALYTFHYVPEITQVVELLPPDAPGGHNRALLLDPTQVGVFLEQPLADTVPPHVDRAQQLRIDAVTSAIRDYSYQQQFDGTYQMVLSLPSGN